MAKPRAKRGRQGEGGGRPKKVIDYESAEKLAALQCTQEEIASFLKVSVDTLTRDEKFCGIYKEGINNGRMSLRRHQWKALEEGNTTMLVWLGKQYLSQRDKFDVDQKSTVTHDLSQLTDSELLALIAEEDAKEDAIAGGKAPQKREKRLH